LHFVQTDACRGVQRDDHTYSSNRAVRSIHHFHEKEDVHLENSTYKDEIFTKRVRAGKRTYFFDVKATKSEKDFYITITESKRVGEEEYEKHKIFLYKEDFDKFADALMETVDYVQDELLVTPPADHPVIEEKV
jgi:Protein of unknown function (DUF3276)